MGRKYSSDSSDDGLPELDDFINSHVNNLHNLRAPTLIPTSRPFLVASPERASASRTAQKAGASRGTIRTAAVKQEAKSKPAASRGTRTVKTKTSSKSTKSKDTREAQTSTFSTTSKLRATPHRKAKNAVPVADLLSESDDDDSEYMTAEEKEQSDVEESIWCDSEVNNHGSEGSEEIEADDGDDFTFVVKRTHKSKDDMLSRLKSLQVRTITPDTELSDSNDDLDSNIFRSRSPRKALTTYKSPGKVKKQPMFPSTDSSDKENDSSVGLKLPTFTLPRPGPASTIDRPSTPPLPLSPSKSKLVSPSKKKARIPTPPHRPSIDAFWNPHAVNDWNDQYSPQKPLVSPKKHRFLQLDTDASETSNSAPKTLQSPTKRTRAEIQAKKDFETRKHKLCEEFLEELDQQVTGGKIKELAASTGGVHFVWSKTLNSTAGRANWRRETVRSTNADGTAKSISKHHASIELAEKVINDEERLLNVVAHEFCHLANFMVSEIKDQPHGRQFKAWGAKCTKLFAHRGVEVTTKHSYEIDYKYIWACTNDLCRQEYKRHSKSIDPSRHQCGICRDSLMQVKPVPRKQSQQKPGGKAAVGGYAAFVKDNFASIKQSMVGASHKEVMTALGQRYREQKAALAEAEEVESAKGVDDMVKALEVVTLD
ncbi:hypothetical protein AAFC00_004146 [Neodothiora populina]|uniref:SprT-like domain-containing protein n=1 Tax=Neodothiora populina TaxID=2781224 RepID=A0ABR3PIQ2_9PEZI